MPLTTQCDQDHHPHEGKPKTADHHGAGNAPRAAGGQPALRLASLPLHHIRRDQPNDQDDGDWDDDEVIQVSAPMLAQRHAG